MSGATLSVDVWRIWLREYGAAGAIQLATSHGYDRAEILRVNCESRQLELRLTGKSESPTSHNLGIKS